MLGVRIEVFPWKLTPSHPWKINVGCYDMKDSSAQTHTLILIGSMSLLTLEMADSSPE